MPTTRRTNSRRRTGRRCDDDDDSCDEMCVATPRYRSCTRSRSKSACATSSSKRCRTRSKAKCPKTTKCIARTKSGQCVETCSDSDWTTDPDTGKCVKPGTQAHTALLLSEERRRKTQLPKLKISDPDKPDMLSRLEQHKKKMKADQIHKVVKELMGRSEQKKLTEEELHEWTERLEQEYKQSLGQFNNRVAARLASGEDDGDDDEYDEEESDQTAIPSWYQSGWFQNAPSMANALDATLKFFKLR